MKNAKILFIFVCMTLLLSTFAYALLLKSTGNGITGAFMVKAYGAKGEVKTPAKSFVTGKFLGVTGRQVAGSLNCTPSPETCNKIDDDCDGTVDGSHVCPVVLTHIVDKENKGDNKVELSNGLSFEVLNIQIKKNDIGTIFLRFYDGETPIMNYRLGLGRMSGPQAQNSTTVSYNGKRTIVTVNSFNSEKNERNAQLTTSSLSAPPAQAPPQQPALPPPDNSAAIAKQACDAANAAVASAEAQKMQQQQVRDRAQNDAANAQSALITKTNSCNKIITDRDSCITNGPKKYNHVKFCYNTFCDGSYMMPKCPKYERCISEKVPLQNNLNPAQQRFASLESELATLRSNLQSAVERKNAVCSQAQVAQQQCRNQCPQRPEIVVLQDQINSKSTLIQPIGSKISSFDAVVQYCNNAGFIIEDALLESCIMSKYIGFSPQLNSIANYRARLLNERDAYTTQLSQLTEQRDIALGRCQNAC
ncbi:hypothetical protein HY485_00010 [Candidatus Woesearchaeota archaeon]|nr:hypothetical protein [Candidatus Woesearchaeota archaeon]